jgi:RNAse (barnase) inhibitor barstar
MRIIELEASHWKSSLDFYNALLVALGAPHDHGRNINALIDSMFYGGINKIDPPYTIRIRGGDNLPTDVREEIKSEVDLLQRAREQIFAPGGGDAKVWFDTDL